MTSDDMIEEVEDRSSRPSLAPWWSWPRGPRRAEAVIIVDLLRRVRHRDGAGGAQRRRTGAAEPQGPRDPRRGADGGDRQLQHPDLAGRRRGGARLATSELVGEYLKTFDKEGRLVAAICAAPLAFQAHQVFAGGR
jgi:hypothetical protein